jgi:hypothetical protein
MKIINYIWKYREEIAENSSKSPINLIAQFQEKRYLFTYDRINDIILFLD